MNRSGIVGERAIALFVIAILALCPPLLTIFNRDLFAFGVPLLFIYLFCVWVGLILLVGLQAHVAGKEAERERALSDQASRRPEA